MEDKKYYTLQEIQTMNKELFEDIVHDTRRDMFDSDYGDGSFNFTYETARDYIPDEMLFNHFEGIFFDKKGNEISYDNRDMNYKFNKSKIKTIETDVVLTEDITFPEDEVIVIKGNLYGNGKNISGGMILAKNIENIQNLNCAKVICTGLEAQKISISEDIKFSYNSKIYNETYFMYENELGLNFAEDLAIRPNDNDNFIKQKLDADVIVGKFWIDELEDVATHQIKTVVGFTGGDIKAGKIKNGSVLAGEIAVKNLENCELTVIHNTGDTIISTTNNPITTNMWEFNNVDYGDIYADNITSGGKIKAKDINAKKIFTTNDSIILASGDIQCSKMMTNTSLVYAKNINCPIIQFNNLFANQVTTNSISGIYTNCQEINVKDSLIIDKIIGTRINKSKKNTFIEYSFGSSKDVEISIASSKEKIL